MPSDSIVPAASIVVPTRARLDYLEVALASLAPQAAAAGSELIVVDDAGASVAARVLSERFGARYEPHPQSLGLNVARNTGVERSSGELVVFVDDDVEVCRGWLAAMLDAARAHPEAEVFTGPIRVRLEGSPPHSCGREPPPITSLYLGAEDGWARFAWGANMAIRRSALKRVGPFDISLEHGGDEQEWQDRLRAHAPGARVLYVGRAAVDHRRTGADTHLRALMRTAHARGRAARLFDVRAGRAPSPVRELATLVGCAWHVVRRLCPAGLTMVAHSAGRLRECVRHGCARASQASTTLQADAGRQANTDDFLSGHSGTVGGLDGTLRGARDAAIDGWEIASVRRLRLHLAARHEPPLRKVLAIGVVRPEYARLAAGVRTELELSRHEVEFYTCPPGELGKFENLNRLLAEHPVSGHDWLLVVDDDIKLPRGFLDRLLFLCEHFDLRLAQPAHRLRSHGAWPVTRRRPGSVVRETRFVEIGPVTAFAQATFAELLPLPELRMGWGLDAHWAALARAHGWRCGVVDAVAIAHRAAPAASAYSYEAAVREAREFLAERPYLSADEAQQTLTTHRRW